MSGGRQTVRELPSHGDAPDEIERSTRSLKARIEALQLDRRLRSLREARQALLLRAFDADPWPEVLICDPSLQPVDKILWLVLALEARLAAQPVRLPASGVLAARCRVEGRATLTKAMTGLRCGRWLTVCTRPKARVSLQGAVYVLHATPLPVADTLFLDPGWPEFLQRTSRHCRAHHRQMARQALKALESAQSHRR